MIMQESTKLVLAYSNSDDNARKYKARRYYVPKGIIKNNNVIINRKNFYDQPIHSDIKRYKEIRKLTIGQGEDYTAEFLLDYDYIKNHYRLIAVDLNKQKELDTDPKAIQQIEFVGKLKKKKDNNNNATYAVNDQSIFVLTISKIKETRLKFSQGSVTVL